MSSKNTASSLVVSGQLTLQKLVKFLGTWNGTDNTLELLQNVLKVLIPILHLKASLQAKAGLSKSPVSGAATRLSKLAPLIGDSRMLFRFWGSLPILQWLISLKYPRATKKLTKIERYQCYSMLGYYALEHLFYLRVHDIIPPLLWTPFSYKPIVLNPRKLMMWSCRCIIVYFLLQFAHLSEDRKLLEKKEKALAKASEKDGDITAQKLELKEKWAALKFSVISTAFKFPVPLHWAVESGIFPNDFLAATISLTSSVLTFTSGWASVAAPAPPPQAQASNAPVVNAKEEQSLVDSIEIIEPPTVGASVVRPAGGKASKR